MSTSESWDVNRHNARCISSVSVVRQCKLVPGWNFTHITLWSSCCSSCGDAGSGSGWRLRVDVIVVVAVLSSDVNWNASAWPPRRCTADRSKKNYSPVVVHVFMHALFCRLRFFSLTIIYTRCTFFKLGGVCKLWSPSFSCSLFSSRLLFFFVVRHGLYRIALPSVLYKYIHL